MPLEMRFGYILILWGGGLLLFVTGLLYDIRRREKQLKFSREVLDRRWEAYHMARSQLDEARLKLELREAAVRLVTQKADIRVDSQDLVQVLLAREGRG